MNSINFLILKIEKLIDQFLPRVAFLYFHIQTLRSNPLIFFHTIHTNLKIHFPSFQELLLLFRMPYLCRHLFPAYDSWYIYSP